MISHSHHIEGCNAQAHQPPDCDVKFWPIWQYSKNKWNFHSLVIFYSGFYSIRIELSNNKLGINKPVYSQKKPAFIAEYYQLL